MNKNITRLLSIMMAGVMILGLSACGNKTNEDKPIDTPPSIEDNTPPSVPDNKEDNKENETPEPTLDVSVSDVVNTLKKVYGENYLPSESLDADTFNMLTGLTSDQYTDFAAEVPLMSAHVDTLFVVKTDDVDSVKSTLEKYHQTQVENTLQYPMNQTKVENAIIYNNADIVVYMMLGGYPDDYTPTEEMSQEDLEAAILKYENSFYMEQGALGVDALNALFGGEGTPEEEKNDNSVSEEVKEPVVDSETPTDNETPEEEIVVTETPENQPAVENTKSN